MATWLPHQLTGHHKKRTTEDAGCFERLLGIEGSMSVGQYEAYSHQVLRCAWAKYEGVTMEHGHAMYFVDDRLVLAITDAKEDKFKTCYHEHFNRRDCTPLSEHPECELGRLRLEYETHLKHEVQGELITSYKRHH